VGSGEAGEAGEEVLALALKALAQKERSVAELRDWLIARRVDEADAVAVIERLAADGALDDDRFARRFAEDKRELAGWGEERIREALEARGIEHHHVESALAGDDEEAQLARALDLLAERGAPVGDDAERGRAFGFLARRGYSQEVCRRAIHERERLTRRQAA
jgi:regulatory protein